jgi:hypothetical protein
VLSKLHRFFDDNEDEQRREIDDIFGRDGVDIDPVIRAHVQGAGIVFVLSEHGSAKVPA